MRIHFHFSLGQFFTWTRQAKKHAFTLCIRTEYKMKSSMALNVLIRRLLLSSAPEETCAVVQQLRRSSQALINNPH